MTPRCHRSSPTFFQEVNWRANMGQLARIVNTALLLGAAAPLLAQSPSPASSPRGPQSPPGAASALLPASMAANRVLGYTAWDDDYFYIALQINKPVVSGKNTQPFSNPLEDDAAIVSLQTD